ncbi:ArsR family transcriptional regulator [bacterium]|nr:ArsR family transcriptional regulator [bacterium]
MTDVPRIEPRHAHRRVQDQDALLVCAYDDARKCQAMALDGAIGLEEFERRKGRIDPGREIIFY